LGHYWPKIPARTKLCQHSFLAAFETLRQACVADREILPSPTARVAVKSLARQALSPAILRVLRSADSKSAAPHRAAAGQTREALAPLLCSVNLEATAIWKSELRHVFSAMRDGPQWFYRATHYMLVKYQGQDRME